VSFSGHRCPKQAWYIEMHSMDQSFGGWHRKKRCLGTNFLRFLYPLHPRRCVLKSL